MILDGHVRMDLLYGRWSPKKQATVDVFTIFFLIFYLVFLLIGALSSVQYALEYNQTNYTSWAPPLAPIQDHHGFWYFSDAAPGDRHIFQGLGKGKGGDD